MQINALSHEFLYVRTVQHASEPRRRLRCWAQHCTAYQHAYSTCIDVLQAGYCGAAAHGRRKVVCLFPTPVGEDDLQDAELPQWEHGPGTRPKENFKTCQCMPTSGLAFAACRPNTAANVLPILSVQLVDHSASLNSSAVRTFILLRSVEPCRCTSASGGSSSHLRARLRCAKGKCPSRAADTQHQHRLACQRRGAATAA